MSGIIEVIQPGSPVVIGADIPATVIGVTIAEHNHVQYHCVWWEGRSRRCEWLELIEVRRVDETQGQKIGFRSNGSLAHA